MNITNSGTKASRIVGIFFFNGFPIEFKGCTQYPVKGRTQTSTSGAELGSDCWKKYSYREAYMLVKYKMHTNAVGRSVRDLLWQNLFPRMYSDRVRSCTISTYTNVTDDVA